MWGLLGKQPNLVILGPNAFNKMFLNNLCVGLARHLRLGQQHSYTLNKNQCWEDYRNLSNRKGTKSIFISLHLEITSKDTMENLVVLLGGSYTERSRAANGPGLRVVPSGHLHMYVISIFIVDSSS